MSLRVTWGWCVFALAAFGAAAWAQAPDSTLAAALPPVALAPVAPAVLTPASAMLIPNRPIDGHERLAWLYVENLGVGSLLDDVAVGAADTLFNTPKEYKTHWSGFGERTGIVTANYGVKSVMEVGLGSIWGEDPRYFRTSGLSTKSRMAYVIKMTFLAQEQLSLQCMDADERSDGERCVTANGAWISQPYGRERVERVCRSPALVRPATPHPRLWCDKNSRSIGFRPAKPS